MVTGFLLKSHVAANDDHGTPGSAGRKSVSVDRM
jgi:hypothetical protein